mmetsp:Transcript_39961/g.125532  ORF Transcript_39961/g.125532 Transcript_39961/m.125532 type:complete len:231 (+) Transcript_39961:476-1168(+)
MRSQLFRRVCEHWGCCCRVDGMQQVPVPDGSDCAAHDSSDERLDRSDLQRLGGILMHRPLCLEQIQAEKKRLQDPPEVCSCRQRASAQLQASSSTNGKKRSSPCPPLQPDACRGLEEGTDDGRHGGEEGCNAGVSSSGQTDRLHEVSASKPCASLNRWNDDFFLGAEQPGTQNCSSDDEADSKDGRAVEETTVKHLDRSKVDARESDYKEQPSSCRSHVKRSREVFNHLR